MFGHMIKMVKNMWQNPRSKKLEFPACPLGKQLSHFACPGPLLAGLRQLERFSYDLQMKTREQTETTNERK